MRCPNFVPRKRRAPHPPRSSAPSPRGKAWIWANTPPRREVFVFFVVGVDVLGDPFLREILFSHRRAGACSRRFRCGYCAFLDRRGRRSLQIVRREHTSSPSQSTLTTQTEISSREPWVRAFLIILSAIFSRRSPLTVWHSRS